MSKLLNVKLLSGSFFWLLLFLSACSGETSSHAVKHTEQYTCPMHPQIVEDAPGSCPICKMDLVPMSRQEHAAADTGLGNLVKPTTHYLLANIRTVKPQEGLRYMENTIPGVINYNTNSWRSVASRVAGRIERLYVRYNYQAVSKGQKLMDIYSPDLANAQQELLYVSRGGNSELLEAAKKKLRLLGNTEAQISQVLKTGKPDYTVSIYSPYSGYLTEQSPATAPASGGTVVSPAGAAESSMSGMGASSAASTLMPSAPQAPAATPLTTREGQYVGQGQTIFKLISDKEVWAEFYATGNQLKILKRGSLVQIAATDIPSVKAAARVALVQPYFEEGQRFSLLRAKLANPRNVWKVGQLISVKTDLNREYGTWLPRTAVLSLGNRYVAFSKAGKAFVPVYVQVLQRSGDWVDIGDSIDKDTEIAVNAWFLTDPESFITVDTLRK